MTNKNLLKLAVLSTYTGVHSASWRYKNTQSDQILSANLYTEMAQIAERGKIDALLVVDVPSLTENKGKPLGQLAIPVSDAVVMVSAMAAATNNIGLIATVSTTYNDAQHVAKAFSTLDHLSNGRAGWNMVTTQDPIAPLNFSMKGLLDHSTRYERATEFIELTKQYWENGYDLNSNQLNTIQFNGEYFQTEAKVDLLKPVQGHPVLFQAGSSVSGMNLAAKHGEVVFTAQDNLDDALAFYNNVKGRLANYHRSKDEMVVLPGVAPILASTEYEAKQLLREFNELIDPDFAVRKLSTMVGVDLSTYPIDGPVPLNAIRPENNQTFRSRIQLYKDLAERDNLTIRELSYHAINTSGHYPFVGTPEQLADFMESWYNAGACDGFNVLISHFNEGLEIFVDHVVPILQKKGLRSDDYQGTTLRENLGLSKPI